MVEARSGALSGLMRLYRYYLKSKTSKMGCVVLRSVVHLTLNSLTCSKLRIQFFELHFISPIYGFGFWSVQNESKGGLRVLSVAK